MSVFIVLTLGSMITDELVQCSRIYGLVVFQNGKNLELKLEELGLSPSSLLLSLSSFLHFTINMCI